MLTDAELQDILYRLDEGIAHWRDRARLRQHIKAQAATIAERDQTIAQLRAEVDAHDAALQAQDAEIARLRTLTFTPIGYVAGSNQTIVIYETTQPHNGANGEA